MILEKVEKQEANKMEIICEKKESQDRIHRVGTITLGISLILAGVLFMVSTIFPVITYEMIFQFWPIIFIALGVEILLANYKADKFQYDGGAIIILILLTFFAMGMAGMEIFFQHCTKFY